MNIVLLGGVIHVSPIAQQRTSKILPKAEDSIQKKAFVIFLQSLLRWAVLTNCISFFVRIHVFRLSKG